MHLHVGGIEHGDDALDRPVVWVIRPISQEGDDAHQAEALRSVHRHVPGAPDVQMDFLEVFDPALADGGLPGWIRPHQGRDDLILLVHHHGLDRGRNFALAGDLASGEIQRHLQDAVGLMAEDRRGGLAGNGIPGFEGEDGFLGGFAQDQGREIVRFVQEIFLFQEFDAGLDFRFRERVQGMFHRRGQAGHGGRCQHPRGESLHAGLMAKDFGEQVVHAFLRGFEMRGEECPTGYFHIRRRFLCRRGEFFWKAHPHLDRARVQAARGPHHAAAAARKGTPPSPSLSLAPGNHLGQGGRQGSPDPEIRVRCGS